MGLQKGDVVPNFMSIDTKGNPFDSNSIVGKKPVVLYFYPKDNTPGCTAQACSFRDQYEDFLDLGAEVIGVSGDDLDSHQKFTSKSSEAGILFLILFQITTTIFSAVGFNSLNSGTSRFKFL